MGTLESWWALLALPAAPAIAFAFAGGGMLDDVHAVVVDFDNVNLAILPMFLFSAMFFPVHLPRRPPVARRLPRSTRAWR